MMAVEKEEADRAARDQAHRDRAREDLIFLSPRLTSRPSPSPAPALPPLPPPPTAQTSSTPLTPHRSRKRKRVQRSTPAQSEVDALITTGPRSSPHLLLPPLSPDAAEDRGEGGGEEMGVGGGLASAFLLSDAALDSRLVEWKRRAWEGVDAVPLLSRAFPCPHRPRRPCHPHPPPPLPCSAGSGPCAHPTPRHTERLPVGAAHAADAAVGGGGQWGGGVGGWGRVW